MGRTIKKNSENEREKLDRKLFHSLAERIRHKSQAAADYFQETVSDNSCRSKMRIVYIVFLCAVLACLLVLIGLAVNVVYMNKKSEEISGSGDFDEESWNLSISALTYTIICLLGLAA